MLLIERTILEIEGQEKKEQAAGKSAIQNLNVLKFVLLTFDI